MTTRDDSFKDLVLDQLQGLKGVQCRASFGSYGLYRGEVFFGMVWKSRLDFTTGSKSRRAYLEGGMDPFRPRPRQALKPYYEVPVDVLEDRGQLAQWALEAVRCAAPPEFRKAARRKP